MSTRAAKATFGILAIATILFLAWCMHVFDRPPAPIRSAMRAVERSAYPEAILALEQGAGLRPCTSGSYGTPSDEITEPLLLVDLADVQLARARAASRVLGVPQTQSGPESTKAGESLSPEASLAARCARSAARTVAKEKEFPTALRARAATLAGHAAFLLGDDEGAIAHYDLALILGDGPGPSEATEDAAWNRSLALKRLQSAQDPPDAAPNDPSAGDAGHDGGDGGKPSDDSDAGDGGRDSGEGDGGHDSGASDASDGSDSGRNTNSAEQALLDRLGKLPSLPAAVRQEPGGPRVLPGAEDK